MLSVWMQSQAGGELDSLFVEEERAAHPSQAIGSIEPDEPVLIKAIGIARSQLCLVNESKPAALERDRLRTAAESLGRNWRRALGDGARVLVDHPAWIAAIDEAQIISIYLRHPVLLVQPWPLGMEHTPIS